MRSIKDRPYAIQYMALSSNSVVLARMGRDTTLRRDCPFRRGGPESTMNNILPYPDLVDSVSARFC